MGAVGKILLFVAFSTAAILPTIEPAAAVSAELARQCRAMALKAHPPVPPGSAKGTETAQRAYYQQCIKNGGKMPDADKQPPAPK